MNPFPKPVAERADARSRPGAPEVAAPTSPGAFPGVRMRRNRKAAWSRRLVGEHALSPSDLIWPIFLIDRTERRTPIQSMPGVDRVNIEEAVRDAELAAELGIP